MTDKQLLSVECSWCGAKQSISDHRSNFIFYRCFHCKKYNLFDKVSNISEKLSNSTILENTIDDQ